MVTPPGGPGSASDPFADIYDLPQGVTDPEEILDTIVSQGALTEILNIIGPDGKPLLDISLDEAQGLNFQEFVGLLLAALRDLKEQLQKGDLDVRDIFQLLHQAQVAEAEGILSTREQLNSLRDDEEAIVQTMTGAIVPVRNANEALVDSIDEDNDQVEAVNDAINDAPPDPAGAVATYNAYASAKNTELANYNALIDNYNALDLQAEVDRINGLKIRFGITPLVDDALTFVKVGDGMPTISGPPFNTINPPLNYHVVVNNEDFPDPILSAIVDFFEGVAEFFTGIFIPFVAVDLRVELLEAEADQQIFNLRGEGPITSPNSFGFEATQAVLEALGIDVSTAGGTSSTGMLTNLVSNNFESRISQRLREVEEEEALELDEETKKLTKLINAVIRFLLNLQGQVAVLGGVPAAARLSNRLGALTDAKGPAAKALLGLGYVKGVQQAVSSNVVPEGLAILETGTVGAGNAPDALTSISQLFLLRFALAEAGLSTNLPGLAPQVLALINEDKREDILLASTRRAREIEVLQNLTVQANIQLQLGALVAERTTRSREDAQKVVNVAFRESLDAQRFGSEPRSIVKFKEDLEDQLRALGIDDQTGEIIGNRFTELLNEQIDAIFFDPANLRGNVLQISLERAGITDTAAAAAIAATLDRGDIGTITAFRAALREELAVAGVNAELAITASQEALIDERANPNLNPLQTLGSDTFLSPSEVKEAFTSHVSKTIEGEVGKEEADKIAEEYYDTLFGEETGIVALFKKELDAVESTGTQRPFEGALGNLRDITNIPREVYLAIKATLDPAEATLNTFLPQQGDKLKKSVDMPLIG